ncbi:hypothetical protein [Streptacidiphilus carbonis]|uniref:hypothetical protein n=1 Tax=Streptacidiphilus carbonis TaxID=105422 RepID=UPI000693E08C|nr:hypothetical protein [Streptacidiphilus carbonis]
MHVSRRASIAVASITCGALAFGAAGTTIALAQQPVTSGGAVSPAAAVPDTSAALAVLSQFGAVGKVTDALTAAGAPTPDLATVTNLVNTAKAALATVVGTVHAPAAKPGHRAATPDPNALVAQAVAAVKTVLDNLVAAVTAKDPAKIAAALTAAVPAVVNLVASLLLGGGLPVPSLPGLPGLPSVPPLPIPLPVPVPPLPVHGR